MKLSKEWYVPAPWGNIAVKSWGSPSGRPVLMVHGRNDSAATFQPLVERLPDKYYFVGIDLPGNGKSDPFPAGLPVWRYYYLGAMDTVVKHLKWMKFIFIGHSMGCELGLFFNVIRPNMITKIIHLDAVPTFHRLQTGEVPDLYFEEFFERFYTEYEKYNYKYKVYTERKALDALKRARGLSEELAGLLMERNLIALDPNGEHYRLSWDLRTGDSIPQNYNNEYYIELFSSSPPSILFNMSEGYKTFPFPFGREASLALKEALKTRAKMVVYDLEGGHDAHLQPDDMVDRITDFMAMDLRKSKL